MFLAFADSKEKPVYFHCWGGADRTGTVGFLLGGLLGMSYTDLIIDYELTSFSCNYRPHWKNDSNKVYRFPAMIYAFRNSTYFAEDKTISQMIEDFLIDKALLTHEEIVQIKNSMLVD